MAALKTNTVLSDLFLGNNRLIADDMVHLGNILKINNTLQLLDLRDNNIQVTIAVYIFGVSRPPVWSGTVVRQNAMHE